jgi:O-antigen ligase
MRFRWDFVGAGFAALIAAAALSLPFAWWLSGSEAALAGGSRWLLLAQSGLVYYLIRAGARAGQSALEQRMFLILFLGAVVSAAYGIVDFVWPIPLPHPAAEQFIWLPGMVLRRAQGVFYESSSFANFCSFFLIAAATAFFARQERYLKVPRSALLVCMVILALAMLVAFSRTTWAAAAAALLASLLLSRRVRLRRLVFAGLALALPPLLVWAVSPDLWDYLVSARLGRLMDVFSDPNTVTSGRFDTWLRVLSIMRDDPQYLLFGVGYKTLPVTRLFRSEIITDNGYLSLLLETGVPGFAALILLSVAVLRTFFRLARSGGGEAAFWGTVLFSIWCGQLVLFLAADAYTYWRNSVVLAALMALTLNLRERALRDGAGEGSP